MSNPEYDAGEPALETQRGSTAQENAESEALRIERMQALDDEAIEAEHIDNFLAGGSDDLL